MKITQFYGYKLGQMQTFNDKGKRLVVTKIKTVPLKIERLKTQEKDGYWALQVKLSPKKGKYFLREISLQDKIDLKEKKEIKPAEIFQAGDLVQVRGITKGRGFSGVIKRWGFHGGPKTHGQSDRGRAPGSIGQGTDPGRVWKGKKMPGHMGNKAKTIKGLKVYKLDEENQEVWLTGLVSGSKGGLLKITRIGRAEVKVQPEKKEAVKEKNGEH
jgi:large subunit ribosomal protein L3